MVHKNIFYYTVAVKVRSAATRVSGVENTDHISFHRLGLITSCTVDRKRVRERGRQIERVRGREREIRRDVVVKSRT